MVSGGDEENWAKAQFLWHIIIGWSGWMLFLPIPTMALSQNKILDLEESVNEKFLTKNAV
jgi:hypothetical protein